MSLYDNEHNQAVRLARYSDVDLGRALAWIREAESAVADISEDQLDIEQMIIEGADEAGVSVDELLQEMQRIQHVLHANEDADRFLYKGLADTEEF